MNPTIRVSSLDRTILCPGSLTLVPRVARHETDDAAQGTAVHWNIADRAIRELGATPPEGGLPPANVPVNFELSPFISWMIDWAIRHLLETVPSDWAIMVEVPLAYEFGRFSLSGHVDVVAINPGGTEAIGVDWKAVLNPVDPAYNNEQVAGYIVLLKRAWPTLRKITFEIAQPRVDEDSGVERVSSVTVEGDAIEAVCASMEARINTALDHTMEVDSGLKQCWFCDVGIQCPALQAKLTFMKMTLTEQSIANVKANPDDAQLGDWIITMRTLKKPTEQAEELIQTRLDTMPVVVAGCGTSITRKTQKGGYSVPDPVRFFSAVRQLLPEDESIAKTFTPSMSRIKDEIAEVNQIQKGGKGAVTAEGIFDSALRPLVEQKERRVLVFTT